MTDGIWDPREVSVKIGNYEIPDIMEIEPEYGIEITPASTPQGFVGHEITYKESSIRVKFKATDASDVVAGLMAYMANQTAVTVTYINPLETATFTNARLSKYPTRTNSDISGASEYEVTLTGKCSGPQPRA